MADDTGSSRSKPGPRPRPQVPPVQMPWAPPILQDRPIDPLSPENVVRLDAAVRRILSDVGIDVQSTEVAQILRQAGCRVTGTLVRMDGDFLTEMLARAPRRFDIIPRNPDRTISVGDGHLLFGSVSSPPNAWDMERGKRPGDRAAMRDLLRLSQHFNCIHFIGGYPVEPAEVPPSLRHFECLAEMLRLSDKACNVYGLNATQAEESMEMVRIAAGVTEEEFRQAPRMFSNINSVSPLKHDGAALEAALRFARAGQAVFVTPFAAAGISAPATPAGAVALSLAEALSAIALLQYASPGCPVALGSFTPTADMKSGAMLFATPESLRATQIAGQMARHYGLPLRASNACGAPVPDGQAMWESAAMLWTAVRSGASIIYHAAGWIEGGMSASCEKFLMDCEVLQQIQRYCAPGLSDCGDEALSLDLIARIGHGGHYFGHAQTDAQSRDAFLRGFLSDTRSYENWAQDGAVWTSERAHRMVPRMLADCVDPPLPEGAQDQLDRFLDLRRRAAGVAEPA